MLPRNSLLPAAGGSTVDVLGWGSCGYSCHSRAGVVRVSRPAITPDGSKP